MYISIHIFTILTLNGAPAKRRRDNDNPHDNRYYLQCNCGFSIFSVSVCISCHSKLTHTYIYQCIFKWLSNIYYCICDIDSSVGFVVLLL